MSGFENLEGAVDLNKALAPITPDEVAVEDQFWSDDVALGIVLADVASAIAYEQSKNFVADMEMADSLLRQQVTIRKWPNSDKLRSGLGVPLVLEAVEKIIPTIQMAIWGSGKDPFLVVPRGKTTAEAARAWQHILRWAVRTSDFKENTRLCIKSALTYGFTVGSYGWEMQELKRERYKFSDDGRVVRDDDADSEYIPKPTFECLNLRNVLFDPSCTTQDIRNARWLAKRITVSAYELAEFREDETYKNVPSDDELRAILATDAEPTVDSMQGLKPFQNREYQAQSDILKVSKDPLANNLEILEYWTADRIITVLQKKIVIRNEQNPFGKLPVVSCAFIDVPNSSFGFGVAKLLYAEQKLQQGILNTWVDSLSLSLSPTFQIIKGMGAGNQNIPISPGKIINVESELKPLVSPSVSAEAMGAIAASEDRAYRRVGANGGSNVPTQALRTSTGISTFQGDVTQRLQYWLEIFLNLVFVPTLEAFLQLCKQKLDDPVQLNKILSDEDGKAYEGNILDVYNAEVQFDILSGVKLTTRQAAAQIAPLILQMVQSEPVHDSLLVRGETFDLGKFLADTFELMGLDWDSYVVPATPADMQRAQMMNPAAVKAQSDSQLQQQRHQDDIDSIDAKAAAQAGVATVRSALKHHEELAQQALYPEESNGQ